jgi:hypothetical protein
MEKMHWNFGCRIKWNYISVELEFIFGFRIVIGLLCYGRGPGRIWYYKHVDDFFFKMFPRLYLGKEYRHKHIYRILIQYTAGCVPRGYDFIYVYCR